MFKKIKPIFKKKEVKVGNYVLLAIKEEMTLWKSYQQFNALSPDKRLRIIDPTSQYDRSESLNCYIARIKKPITRSYFKVVGIRDGIVVKSVGKGHPRSKADLSYDTGMFKFNIRLNNILEIVKDRDEMIVKRNLIDDRLEQIMNELNGEK